MDFFSQATQTRDAAMDILHTFYLGGREIL